MHLPAHSVLLDRRRFFNQRSEAAGLWQFPAHSHNGFSEIFYLAHGTLLHSIGQRSDRLTTGSLALVRERDRHSLAGSNIVLHNLNLRSDELTRAASFLGDGARLLELLADSEPVPPAEVPPGERAALVEAFDQLIRCRDHQGEERSFERLLIGLLHRFLEVAVASADGRPRWLDPVLADAVGMLARTTPSRIARQAGVSEAHLSRTMRRVLGCGPAAWLNRLRLERAAQRLTHDREPIADIATTLGFRHIGWFYRLFSRTYGLPPAAYRQRYGVPGIGTDKSR